MVSCRKIFTNVVTACLLVVFIGPAQAEGPSGADLAQANNPLANMVAFNIQNYRMSSLYDAPDAAANTLWLRYARPMGRVLVRASLPINTVPTLAETESGLGDFNIFGAYLVTDQASPRTFGIGPLLAAPTAGKDVLGAGKWQGGLAAVLFDASSPQVQWGGLLTWQGSFAGDEERDNTSLAVMQPFMMVQVGGGTYLRTAPLWIWNTRDGTYSLPFSVGIGKITKVGNTVFNLFIEPQYTFLHKGAGQPEFQVFTGINLQFMGQ